MSSEFPNMAAVMKWRETDGHSEQMMDQSSWVSMTAQICNHDPSLPLSTAQVGFMQDIAKYNDMDVVPGIGQGPLLCALCFLPWILCMSLELRGAMSLKSPFSASRAGRPW